MSKNEEDVEITACLFCKGPFSKNFIAQIKENNGNLFCEYCGEKIDRMNYVTKRSIETTVKDQNVLEKPIKKEDAPSTIEEATIVKEERIPTKEEIEDQLKVFVFRRAYELLKDPHYILKLKKDQKDLDAYQLKVMAGLLRSRLIHLPFEEEWLAELSPVHRQVFEYYSDNFTRDLKSKKYFREQYMEFFQDAIQLIFGLIKGYPPKAGLQETRLKILIDLKKVFGFSFFVNDINTFEFQLTLFLAAKLYYSKSFRNKVLKFFDNLEEINQAIDRFVLENAHTLEKEEFLREWINTLKRINKMSFKIKLNNLLSEMNTDHVFCESFLDHLEGLIRIVLELIRGEYQVSQLDEVKLRILNFLLSTNPFVSDRELQYPFLSNFMIVLAWIVRRRIQNNQEQMTKARAKASAKILLEDISTRKIMNYHLHHLNEISQEIFEENYAKVQYKITHDRIYRGNFSKFLYSLFLTVFKLIHEKCDPQKLSEEEYLIFQNFKSYHESLEKIDNKTVTKEKLKDYNLDSSDEEKSDISYESEIPTKFDIGLSNKKQEGKQEGNDYFIEHEAKGEGLIKLNEKLQVGSEIKKKHVFMNQVPSLFEKFLYQTHEIKFIRELIKEFNKKGNWIQNLHPTTSFLNFLKGKLNELESFYKISKSNNIKNKINVLSDYIVLINEIRENNALKNLIREKLFENKGKYGVSDLQEWLLISDPSARHQLKMMLTEQEYQEYIRTQKFVSIDTVKEIVIKKGGKCHTTDLQNAKSKLHIECFEGHHFYPTYDSLVYQGTWCPHCHIFVGETICRRFFELIFKKPFPKSYPSWLINENGNQMELDGRNKDLRISFEYQGIQHRKKAFGNTDEDLCRIQREDKLKQKLCKENGEILLQIPDDKIVPYSKMQEYIENEYRRKTGITLKDIPRFDYRNFVIHENKYAKQFREYLENKGALLLSPYFNAKTDVTILCEVGHEWTTTPDSIYQGHWCSACSGNMKGEIELFQQIGRKFRCDLISEYVNAKSPLWYRCSMGHEFKRDPYWLKRAYEKIKILCPRCKEEIYGKEFEKFVNKKGGRLLTPYKGRFKSINVKCKENHTWTTTPAEVYQGSWCKDCKINATYV